MRTCACKLPMPKVNKPHLCVKCGDRFGEEWNTTDRNVAKFFNGLVNCFGGGVPAWFDRFRAQAIEREHVGRSTYYYEYLNRDNCTEGQEEAVDGALYAYMEVLRNIREGNDDQYDMALDAAYHFAIAYDKLAAMRAKERGRP